MSQLPWEVDRAAGGRAKSEQSDSHTSICDHLTPTTLRLDPEFLGQKYLDSIFKNT